MKLRSCFLFMCMVVALLSCSNNDEPAVEQPKTPVVPNASLALAVQTADRIVTKANDNATAAGSDEIIKTLTALVFNANDNGGYAKNGYHVGDIVYSVSVSMDTPEALAEVDGLGLLADKVDILLLANIQQDILNTITSYVDANAGIAHYNLDDVLALKSNLQYENEYTEAGKKGLTMSALLNGVTLASGNNYIGYAKNKGDLVLGTAIADLTGEIKLVRTVSRVQLNQINLTSSNEFGSLALNVKEVFVANVKSLSKFGIGDIEVPYDGKNTFYLTGSVDGDDEIGLYKAGAATIYPDLMVGFNDLKLQSVDFASNTPIPENQKVTVSNEQLALKGNKPFYVYYNQRGERTASETKADIQNNYTLLVLKGDYTYLENGSPRTLQDRYYTIIINDPNFRQPTEDPGYNHVKRNTKYWVNLTISGSGSDKAYEPASFAHVAASVQVTPWSVVKIEETVD